MKLNWSFLDNKNAFQNHEDVALCFTKCFSSPEGKRVLSFLSSQIKDRFLSAESSTNELWFCEGKRALLAQIEYLINKGKKGE